MRVIYKIQPYFCHCLLVIATVLLPAMPANAADAKNSKITAANHLAGEVSPYLLQHAENPVDWHPWGDIAQSRAHREGKLIFLSIGYSTCHWCHVMAHESFEDAQVAALLNRDFIAIKVDREERPDIDQVYMDVCMKLTGRGGWPLTIIMTPDGHPVFAGTYIPKENRYGSIGLLQLLPQLAERWQQQPDAMRSAGVKLIAELQQNKQLDHSSELPVSVFAAATETLKQSYDRAYGGFGQAPKFPRPHGLTFLLQRSRRSAEPLLEKLATHTLDRMRNGGIYDQLGFGFHRYSTDRQWLVPHFEKMLYDQAGLASAYLEAYQLTGEGRFARTAREIFEFVQRDMRGKDGGFVSAIDADSEGIEGRYYLWRHTELVAQLGAPAANSFAEDFGVQQTGNFSADIPGEPAGSNILHRVGVPLPNQESAAQRTTRLTLLKQRSARIAPHVDDKVITAWNGMLISALARGARVLDDPHLAEVADQGVGFILARLQTEDGRLLRRYRVGKADISGFAEDYAYMARALLDLYEIDFAPLRLQQASRLMRYLLSDFRDDTGQLLYDSGMQSERLVLRPRSVFDGAYPAAVSIAVEVLARLYLLTGDVAWRIAAEALLSGVSAEVVGYPAGSLQLLQGASLLLEPSREIVIVGERNHADTQALLNVVMRSYGPERSVLLLAKGERELLATIAPFTADMQKLSGRATAYVCQGFACLKPLNNPEQLQNILAYPPLPPGQSRAR